jgi:hypothetical protein
VKRWRFDYGSSIGNKAKHKGGKMKQFIVLVDNQGVEWVRAELSKTRAERLVKSYALAGIQLLERSA